MVPTDAELLLARAAELRAIAAEASALLPQFDMSEQDAREFIDTLGPLDRAKMRDMSAELKTFTPEQRLELLRWIARLVTASSSDPRSMS